MKRRRFCTVCVCVRERAQEQERATAKAQERECGRQIVRCLYAVGGSVDVNVGVAKTQITISCAVVVIVATVPLALQSAEQSALPICL